MKHLLIVPSVRTAIADDTWGNCEPGRNDRVDADRGAGRTTAANVGAPRLRFVRRRDTCRSEKKYAGGAMGVRAAAEFFSGGGKPA
jgi:hypothetical protein